MNFRSDNEAPVAPEIMEALARANSGTDHSYGADAATARLQGQFSELFETEVAVFPVITGTAANALSLAQSAPPYGAIYCHRDSHIHVDECNAPEFYTGGAKLHALDGAHGRIDLAALEAALAATGFHGDHEPEPAAISLTQATEAGAVYAIDDIAALAEAAHGRGLRVHMDGARIANAVARLGRAPADMTWRAGIDILSFGATKNGAMAAEAVVVFRRDLVDGLARRRMRGGHLLSKMRFVSAQLEAYIADGLWLTIAARANRAASRLADGLSAIAGVTLLHPVEGNELFARLPAAALDGVTGDGFEFHRWPGAESTVRFVCSYAARDGDIDALIASLRRHCGAAADINP
jgi:threonine aldolase